MDRIVVNGIEYVRTQPAVSAAPAVKRIPQPKMVERKCKCCRSTFWARAADVKRGWGLYCSKSCKAIKQEAQTGQYRAHLNASLDPRERQLEDGRYEFCSAHLFSNEEHDCNKD